MDNDYGYVILGRDITKVFRAIDLSSEFYETAAIAKEKLIDCFAKYENDGKQLYNQGDEKKVPNEILVPKSIESNCILILIY